MTPPLVAIGTAQLFDGVEVDVAERGDDRLVTLRTTHAVAGVATKWFAVPAVHVPFTISDPDAELLGFAYTQFLLPVTARAGDLDFDFTPAHNLQSPPALGLLLARTDDRCALVAPITQVHEQIISAERRWLRWGWHGDLDEVPAGLAVTMGVYEGRTPAELLARWARDLHGGIAPVMRRRDRNPITSHLSYWTDNGAAYWYRTEPGRTIGDSVSGAVASLHDAGVPVRAVELDSWFYPHEILRPIAEIGYPAEVPPTGMVTWTPRDDAFTPVSNDGADALERWSIANGRPPLALHARHIGNESPYLAEGEWWVDLLATHPKDPEFFRRWFEDARRWGVCCIEQDWMMMYWFGVRALREAPDRALHWQGTLDRLAGEYGIGLLWCMANPADLFAAVNLPNVVAVRTSDDYRFAADPAILWLWYLTVNRLAGELGLPAFKDVFFSRVPNTEDADPIDGDPHAEVEALLSAMSAGVAGIGDRIGHTDAELVMRLCDTDGRLRHVDRPLALVDCCLFGAPRRGERLAWATTTVTRDDGVWTYVVALHCAEADGPITDTFELPAEAAVYDWRARRESSVASITVTLAHRDWAMFVVAPDGHTLAATPDADPTKFVVLPTIWG